MKDAVPAAASAAAPPGVEIEYVADSMVDASDPLYEEWSKIFNHFQKSKDEKEEAAEGKEGGEDVTVKKAAPVKADEDDDDEDGEGKSKEKLSRKKFKLLNRLSIAELKQLVKRPDVVEVWDVTSSDPRLLVFLKSYRNTVPVPRHWCNKRKYLQGKRGIEKLPFQLPSFIEATGIAKLRQAYEDKNAEQSAKQKARNQSRPKMSKMDIDYQVRGPSAPDSSQTHKPLLQNHTEYLALRVFGLV
jgi:splicing factor 3B subunit 2